jgi:ribosome recycling factor
MLNDALKELKDNQTKAIDAFKKELGRVRTGRANLAVLEPVRVNYYGTKVPLNQVAAVSVTDARLIVIKPWDKSMISEIEKAVNVAEIGLTPQSDGEVVRLPIPTLTEERRKELVRGTRKMEEEAKVRLRNIRRESNEFIKELKDSGEITEDEMKQGLDKVQKETDEAIKKLDEIMSDKEKEIMEV